MLPNILYEIREQKHGQDFKDIRDCRHMTVDVRLRRKYTLQPLMRTEVRKDTAQNEMCKAGLEKSLNHQQPPTTTDSTLSNKEENRIAEGI